MATKKEKENYWKRRNEELEAKWADKSQKEIEKELAQYYQQALTHIQKNVNDLYARFATENGLSTVDAQRLLQGKEFRTWRMDMKDYLAEIERTGDTALLRELNTLVMRSRITRFDKLYAETLVEMARLAEKTGKSFDKFLPTAYTDFYYRNLYEIAKAGELKNAVTKVDPKKIEEVMRVPWSGKNYSQRIWNNDQRLASTIQQVIVQATHRGTSIADLSRLVSQRMNVGLSDATRLVRTELNYVQNRAAIDGIRDAGFEYYRISAAFDKRTCSRCASKDGTTVPIDKADPGDTAPPFHARCRCSVSACFEAGEPRKGRRIARDENGRNIRIPADMKYEDWKAVYIDKTKTVSDFGKNAKNASTLGTGSAIIEAEKRVADIEAQIKSRQKKIDDLEAERANIETIAEASAITRKQQVFEDEIRDLKRKLEDAKDELAAQKNIEKYGDRYGFKKILGKHTRRQDLRVTNPHFTEGVEWQVNCQRCTVTYELRRRGYDVTALSCPGKGDEFAGNFSAMLKNPNVIDIPGATGDECRKAIEEQMANFGNGARAIVRVGWPGTFDGHVFIAEQIRGKTYFFDPQSGFVRAAFHFENCDPSGTRFLRIDNLEFNQKILQCCEDAKRK